LSFFGHNWKIEKNNNSTNKKQGKVEVLESERKIVGTCESKLKDSSVKTRCHLVKCKLVSV
jgi:hypothetical protein